MSAELITLKEGDFEIEVHSTEEGGWVYFNDGTKPIEDRSLSDLSPKAAISLLETAIDIIKMQCAVNEE